MPSIHKILAITALCLAAGACLAAPEQAVLEQAVLEQAEQHIR